MHANQMCQMAKQFQFQQTTHSDQVLFHKQSNLLSLHELDNIDTHIPC